jgi:hypothetical protein
MNAKQLLMEGLADAAGFVSGAMLAFGIAKLLGLDVFAPGYSNSTMFGIVLLGLGGGLGLQAARRLRAAWQANKAKQENDQ